MVRQWSAVIALFVKDSRSVLILMDSKPPFLRLVPRLHREGRRFEPVSAHQFIKGLRGRWRGPPNPNKPIVSHRRLSSARLPSFFLKRLTTGIAFWPLTSEGILKVPKSQRVTATHFEFSGLLTHLSRAYIGPRRFSQFVCNEIAINWLGTFEGFSGRSEPSGTLKFNPPPARTLRFATPRSLSIFDYGACDILIGTIELSVRQICTTLGGRSDWRHYKQART